MSGEPDADLPREPARGHRRRRAARRQAIEILYQADLTGRPPSEVAAGWTSMGRSVSAYAEYLITGVEEDLEEIDALLGASTEGWAVYRMAAVDRTILRVACHELRSGIPAAVAISEAVVAANEL
jgi:N utilization substance protein B